MPGSAQEPVPTHFDVTESLLCSHRCSLHRYTSDEKDGSLQGYMHHAYIFAVFSRMRNKMKYYSVKD